ncbi:MAG: helix-turn-helix domain-containing protein [Ignavibacteriaceae bacterium]|nr:helix-turn-helix domain-containing protein [Ignavibacteriaceae bacterium]
MNEEVMNEARKLIGQRVKERRQQLKISQKQLAETCGIGLNTLIRFESGRFWISFKQFLPLIQALDMYFFLAEKDSPEPWAKIMRERWRNPADHN